jgi:hypothetical protein
VPGEGGWAAEAAHVADFAEQPGGGQHGDAADGQQRGGQGGQGGLEGVDLLGQAADALQLR